MKNISQAELEALLETAGEDGVTLEDLDLRGLDLSGQCLPGLAVIRCCAEHVNFRGTHFEGIGATDSNFYGADFTGCHFEDAQFSRCNLRASFWSDVTADALTFDGCDLTDATTPEGTVLNVNANKDPEPDQHAGALESDTTADAAATAAKSAESANLAAKVAESFAVVAQKEAAVAAAAADVARASQALDAETRRQVNGNPDTLPCETEGPHQ